MHETVADQRHRFAVGRGPMLRAGAEMLLQRGSFGCVERRMVMRGEQDQCLIRTRRGSILLERMQLRDFSMRVLRRVARINPARAVPTMPMPRAAIGHGAAGVALFLAELARDSEGAARRRAADH